jgi:hypothetical protein
MAGLVPAIHVFFSRQDVDARDEPAHDEANLEINSEKTNGKYA